MKRRQRWPKQSELSKYFDISRYAATENFSIRHWAGQLYFRKMLRFCTSTEERRNRSSLDFHKLILQLFADPIANPNAAGPMWTAAKYCAINDVELHDVWWLRNQLESDPEVVAQMNRLYDSESNDSLPSDSLPYESLAQYGKRKGWSNSRDRMVTVNLNAPKEMILKDFAAWLDMRSKEHGGIPHRFTDADMRQWYRHRILAYLDLDMLQRVLDVDIPNHVIGELLFPEDTDVDLAERVRKVVKPLAESLMTSQLVDMLDFASADEVYGDARKRFRPEIVPE